MPLLQRTRCSTIFTETASMAMKVFIVASACLYSSKVRLKGILTTRRFAGIVIFRTGKRALKLLS